MQRRVIASLSIVAICFLSYGELVSAQSVQRTPEQVAQALVDAFNARDIEAIMRTYSLESIAYRLPDGEAFIKGHVEIRKKFTTAFERDPKTRVEVVDRIVDGKFVIDKEKLTGESEGKQYERYVTVIYEITDGLIRKEWYLRK